MADVEAPYLVDRPGLGELLVTVASVGGLLTGGAARRARVLRAACALVALRP